MDVKRFSLKLIKILIKEKRKGEGKGGQETKDESANLYIYVEKWRVSSL